MPCLVPPSVVALQEVECNSQPRKCRYWSAVHADDQVAKIANICGLQHVCFRPTLAIAVPQKRWQKPPACRRCCRVTDEDGPQPSSKEVLEPTIGAAYGNALLSRWPILQTRVLAYSLPVPASEAIDMEGEEQPRLAMACLLELPDGKPPLWVVNTHLSHKFWHREQRRQAGQLATWIREELLASSPEGHPVILCGDMNALPSWTAHAELTARGARDLWGDRPRVPTMPSSRYTRRWPNTGWVVCGHIDNVFAFTKATKRERAPSAEEDGDAAESEAMMSGGDASRDAGVGSVQAWLTVVKSSTEALVASDHCSVIADIQI